MIAWEPSYRGVRLTTHDQVLDTIKRHKHMPLQLYPELDDLTREQIEQHLDQVRARRVLAALEYVAGQNMKLTYEAEKTQKKIAMVYERLGKAIQKLDAADELVQRYLIEIEELKQALGFAVSQVTVTNKEDDV